MPFTLSQPLRFGDCDLTGIAYHPAYFSMLVEVNRAMFASFGISWEEMMNKRGYGMPVVNMQVEFYKPSTFGDVLDFSMHVRRIGTSSLDLETFARVDSEVIWAVKQRIVLTSTEDHKSRPWPEDVRAGLSRYMNVEKD